MNGIEGTSLYTGAVAAAGIRTSLLRSARNHHEVITIGNSAVMRLLLCLVTVSLTMHMGDLFHIIHGNRARPHNCGNLLCYRSASYGTLVHRSLSFSNRLCTTVTTRKSASTAVTSRESGTNLRLSLIHFHFKFFRGNT